MQLDFGDLFSNALHDLKQHTGKKISLLQDEIGHQFDPSTSGSTIEKWRYRKTKLTETQLAQLADILFRYQHPQHDRTWFYEFLLQGGAAYPELICDKLFPAAEEETAIIDSGGDVLAAPDLSAYRPPYSGGFVGRTAEYANTWQQLQTNRLAILSGMAGVGKTSLAVQVAQSFEADADGLFWHRFYDQNLYDFLRRLAGFLSHFKRPELWEIFEAARLSGATPPDVTTCFDILVTQLIDFPVLLCLDDLQFVDDHPALIGFLQRLTADNDGEKRPMLLITSRRFPHFLISANQTELKGLTVEDTKQLLTNRQLILADDLITELHLVTAGNGAFLTMAAVVLKQTHNVAELIGRLATTDDIERFLLEEVDDRLTSQEQQVMIAVAILSGYSGQRDVLEAMLDQQNIRLALRSLTDQHLLMGEEGPDGRAYSQHQILQAFYYLQPTRKRRVLLHQRAAAYYAAEGQDNFQTIFHYGRAGMVEQTVHLASEQLWGLVNQGMASSVRAVLASLDEESLDESGRIAYRLTLGQLESLLGEYDSGQERFEQAAAMLQTMPVNSQTNQLKAQVCLYIGELLERQSPPEALNWVQRGLEIVDAEQTSLTSELQIQAGTLMMHMGNFGGALEQLLGCLDELPQHNSALQIKTYKNLGAIYWHLKQLPLALQYSEKALSASRHIKNHLQTARISINLGPIKYTLGDWDGAIVSLEDALEIAQRLGSHTVVLSLHVNLGRCYLEKGNEPKSKTHLEQALVLAEESGAHQAIPARINLARVHLFAKRYEQALAVLEVAEEDALVKNDQLSLAAVHTIQADVYLRMQDLPAAAEHVQEALKEAQLVGGVVNTDVGVCWRIKGEIAAISGDWEAAHGAFTKSVDILSSIDRYQTALTQLTWGSVLLENNELDQGYDLVDQAQAVFAEFGAERELITANALIMMMEGKNG